MKKNENQMARALQIFPFSRLSLFLMKVIEKDKISKRQL